VTPDERWLAAVWPFVRDSLPSAPGRVVEIGCGPLGGFVPMMEAAGYQAIGVDPEAPAGPSYRQAEFEDCALEGLDAIVACTSLHHVADLAAVLDLVAGALVDGGTVVIVEWARERFDESTARWCFDRLPGSGSEHDDQGWLGSQRQEWRESGLPWDAYLRSWAEAEQLHSGQQILDALRARFDCSSLSYGPYFFSDLPVTSEADEQSAICSGMIQANRIQYAGRRRGR
jgi:SAM-dependent methyltransferase